MRLADKVATMARRGTPLPYDAEVEWIQSSGNNQTYSSSTPQIGQYIDLGFLPSNKTRIEIDAQFLTPSNVQSRMFCAWELNKFAFEIYINGTGKIAYSAVDNTSINTGVSANDNRLNYVLDIQNQYIEFGQHKITFSNKGAESCEVPLYLFCLNRPDYPKNPSRRSNIRFFAAKIKEDGGIIMEIKPVRFTNENGETEGAIYDRRGVGGKNRDGTPRNDGMYLNQGTGAFLIGPDKVSANGGGV